MNKITTIITLGGMISAGLASAQTMKPAAPAVSPQPAMAPSAPGGPTSPAAPVSSGITAPVDPNKVVLSIDGDSMTASQFDKWLEAFPPQLQAKIKSQPRQFIEQYTQLRIAAKEAERRKLDKEPKVEQQLALQRDQVLANAFYQDLNTNIKVTDPEIEKYYIDHKSDFETADAHHILIRIKGSQVPLGKDKKDLTDEEALAKAKEVQKRLLAGEDFEKLAKTESDDTTPKGDLKNVKRGQMVKEFDEAVFTLPIGKISDPVKTQFGYHVIRVDSRQTKPLAEVKPEIEQKLKAEMLKKDVDDLKAKANVTVDDQFFRPAGMVTK